MKAAHNMTPRFQYSGVVIGGQQPHACVAFDYNALALRDREPRQSHIPEAARLAVQAAKHFSELENLLHRIGAPVGASECHGFLCGQLCMDARADVDSWRECLGGEGDEFEATLARISQATAGELQSDEYSFELMLPAEEASVAVRTEALAAWCRGFLFGLGNSGLTESVLTGECRELVEDLERIGRARAELEGEEEFALMELIEYVRIGVLTVFHELRPLRSNQQGSKSLH